MYPELLEKVLQSKGLRALLLIGSAGGAILVEVFVVRMYRDGLPLAGLIVLTAVLALICVVNFSLSIKGTKGIGWKLVTLFSDKRRGKP